ncbi:hypothetical protein CALCODRAFT_473876 [Calocera cornea HHB12733]|uniref:GCN5-related N-acetyltransferase Rv2170-like domain-containing protein n=1 Tax=Calocera cornea HHB12733 TaxID=1353952 RepID=A0A165E5D0_9BASI|nr:hypothetical protein CALCODRAFT_473876 [Calocera cornea HHB12733]
MRGRTEVSLFGNNARYRSLKPVRQNSAIISICNHFSARDMLRASGWVLEANSVSSNLILPDAIERQIFEGYGGEVPSSEDSRMWWDDHLKQMEKRALLSSSSTHPESAKPAPHDVAYISVWTIDQEYPSLDFVLACTGRKPVFIFTNRSYGSISPSWLDRRIPLLAERMKATIPERRVFSIVGVEPVVQRLATAWESLTGHTIIPEPYYQATHTFCTRQTLAPIQPPAFGPCRMGLASAAHLTQAGRLCSAFTDSAHDDPYRLSVEQGTQEAKRLIDRKELYVCEAPCGPGQTGWEVVCIVAVTRKSSKVAAVSKVFTHQNHRRKGYAKLLLTHVCHEVLRTEQHIVLFVAHDLTTAAGVYGRVGFVGVGDRPISERSSVERWLELGFKDTEIGHW